VPGADHFVSAASGTQSERHTSATEFALPAMYRCDDRAVFRDGDFPIVFAGRIGSLADCQRSSDMLETSTESTAHCAIARSDVERGEDGRECHGRVAEELAA